MAKFDSQVASRMWRTKAKWMNWSADHSNPGIKQRDQLFYGNKSKSMNKIELSVHFSIVLYSFNKHLNINLIGLMFVTFQRVQWNQNHHCGVDDSLLADQME